METRRGEDTPYSPWRDSEAGKRPWDAEFSHKKGRGRVAIASFFLGVVFGCSLLLIAVVPNAAPFGIYMLLLSTFHLNEYLLTAAFRPDTLNFDNFLLNHSRLYQFMTAVSWIEYWTERAFLADHKCWGPTPTGGLCLSLIGLATRAIAMSTASSNFSHLIEEEQRDEHVLVTHGIYSVLRHPAYFGYFWWAVGTQILLANPICLITYTAATFFFFRNRIPYEEQLLIRFFGQDYIEYRDRTYIGIPFMTIALAHTR